MVSAMDMTQRVDQLKALADPLRLRILALLRGRGKRCVCELLAELGTTQSNISAHLRVLRSVGLIRSQKIGKWVFYALEAEAAGELLAWLEELVGSVEPPVTPSDGLFACCQTGSVPLSWTAAQQSSDRVEESGCGAVAPRAGECERNGS